jgi:CheY-like chemotaxis protein
MTHELRTPLNSILFVVASAARWRRRRPQSRGHFVLEDLFGALRGVMKPLVPSAYVQLIFDDAGAIPPLHSDEGKLSQILCNLVANALKFTDRGEVRVTASVAPDGQLAVAVRDSGIGIAPGTRDIPVIVISVIEGHETAFALGADDFCTKPVERAWLVERLTRLSARSRLDKILIVDDDEASGGVEGLALARQQQPQVIFLDLLMPDRSGFEVLEQLRADPATKDIAVVIFITDIKLALERAGVRPGEQG